MGEFLEELFDKQNKFGLRLGHSFKDLTIREKEKATKEYELAIVAELIELLDCTNWKPWKNQRFMYDDDRMKDLHMELIDILHFWTDLCLVWGLTPKRVIELYREKHEINNKRQDQGY